MEDERKEQVQETENNTQNDVQETSQVQETDTKLSDEDLQAALKAARNEAAKYRVKLRELEDKKKEEEERQLAEQNKYKELYEKTKQDYESITEKLEIERQERELKNIANKFGFIDSEDIRVIGLNDIEYSDGKFIGLEEKVMKLKKKKPYLFKNENNNINDNATGSNSGNSGNVKTIKISREEAKNPVAYRKAREQANKLGVDLEII